MKLWNSLEPANHSTIIHTGPPDAWNKEISLENHRTICYQRLKATLHTYDFKDSHQLVVWDRLHIGSPVYGHLFRPDVDVDGFGDLGRDRFFQFESDLNALNAITVVVCPSDDILIARSLGREDEYLDEVPGERAEQLKKISGLYRNLATILGPALPTFKGLFAQPTAADVLSLAGVIIPSEETN